MGRAQLEVERDSIGDLVFAGSGNWMTNMVWSKCTTTNRNHPQMDGRLQKNLLVHTSSVSHKIGSVRPSLRRTVRKHAKRHKCCSVSSGQGSLRTGRSVRPPRHTAVLRACRQLHFYIGQAAARCCLEAALFSSRSIQLANTMDTKCASTVLVDACGGSSHTRDGPECSRVLLRSMFSRPGRERSAHLIRSRAAAPSLGRTVAAGCTWKRCYIRGCQTACHLPRSG